MTTESLNILIQKYLHMYIHNLYAYLYVKCAWNQYMKNVANDQSLFVYTKENIIKTTFFSTNQEGFYSWWNKYNR